MHEGVVDVDEARRQRRHAEPQDVWIALVDHDPACHRLAADSDGIGVANGNVTADDRCFVVPSGVCMLELPMCISKEMRSRSNGFFKLTAEMEVLAPTSPAAGGTA